MVSSLVLSQNELEIYIVQHELTGNFVDASAVLRILSDFLMPFMVLCSKEWRSICKIDVREGSFRLGTCSFK